MLPPLASPTAGGPEPAGFLLLPRRFACAEPVLQGGLSLLRSLALAVVVLLLPLLLCSCGGPAQPPRAVLLHALALQIQLTQGEIAQALSLEAPGLPVVSRVRVEEQRSVAVGESQGLRLRGRFDWRLAHDPIRVDSPFELVLQRGERGQSWRLARPLPQSPFLLNDSAGNEQAWSTYPLPLPGSRGSS